MLFVLCLALIIPQTSGAATNLGPLRPETPVPGLHENSWKGRYAIIEAEVKHIAKLYKDEFNKFVSSNRECLRAKVALKQSDVHLLWAKGSDLEPIEKMLNDDLRETMRNLCGGGGGGSNPAIELYSKYVKEHGSKALSELVNFLGDNPTQVQVITSQPLPKQYQKVANPRWEALKSVALYTFATSQTVNTYYSLKNDFKRFKETGETSDANKATLAAAGLMFVATTGGTGLILIF